MRTLWRNARLELRHRSGLEHRHSRGGRCGCGGSQRKRHDHGARHFDQRLERRWGYQPDHASGGARSGVDHARFTVLVATPYIQSAAAFKIVEAGTHTCSWTPTDNQGCIIAVVALQA